MKLFDKKNTTVNAIYNFIEEAMLEGRSCLVHSASCKSRAFTVVAVYLIKKYSWSMEKAMSPSSMAVATMEKALDFVKLRKPELKVKQTFLVQLKDLELRLSKGHGFTSDWNEVQNEEDLVLRNTYRNTTILVEEQQNKNNKNSTRKKISWRDGDTRNTTKYNLERNYGIISREPQPIMNQSNKPLKSIMKNYAADIVLQEPEVEVRVVTEDREMVVSKPM